MRRLSGRIARASWRDMLFIGLPALLLIGAVVLATVKFVRPAPPNVIRFIGGDEQSSIRKLADRYKKTIEKYGVKVNIVASEGSVDTLKKLSDPTQPVDVGFVQGGLVADPKPDNLMSLGSMFAQPLMIYYRGDQVVDTLNSFKGKRLAIGPEGSGTRQLTLVLLKACGIDEKNTDLRSLEAHDGVDAILKGEVDGAFFTGDSASGELQAKLRVSPEVHLLSLRQAEAFRRKFKFLSRMTLPEGGRDLAKNWPSEDTQLVGPIIELVARDDLHPALSDLLVGAAKEVHGDQSTFREAGQYPQAIERDFPLSEDAARFYKSGGKFLYKHLPFWLASILDRLLVVFLPLFVILVPITKILPAIYRWRVRSRIYRWYGLLMAIERDIHKSPDPAARELIRKRIDDIQLSVDEMRTPASFADQLYVLRDHVASVRRRLTG